MDDPKQHFFSVCSGKTDFSLRLRWNKDKRVWQLANLRSFRELMWWRRTSCTDSLAAFHYLFWIRSFNKPGCEFSGWPVHTTLHTHRTLNDDCFSHAWISSRYFPGGILYPYCITPPICLFHLPIPSSIPLFFPPPSQPFTVNEAKVALDPTTRSFHVAYQGFSGHIREDTQRNRKICNIRFIPFISLGTVKHDVP